MGECTGLWALIATVNNVGSMGMFCFGGVAQVSRCSTPGYSSTSTSSQVHSREGTGDNFPGSEHRTSQVSKGARPGPPADKNSAPDATRQFQLVNEAYRALGDAEARAQYDAQSYTTQNSNPPSAGRSVEAITCSICHKISAQPRYVIYRHVVSLILVTWRGQHQGIFCSKCGASRAYKDSLRTWLLGWWGIPWGLIYSGQALFSNMFGGDQPALNNFRILSWQASYFASLNRRGLARAVARDALAFSKKIVPREKGQDPETARVVAAMKALIADDNDPSPAPILKNTWGVGSTAFKVQLAAMVLLLILTAAVFASVFRNQTLKVAYRHVPPAETVASSVHQATEFNEAAVPLPATGKIRSLWRANSRTVLPPLEVVTAVGSPNYYLKLINWDTHAPVLVFFVRSGEKTEVEVPVGNYELRYAAGEKWYGEEYLFGPRTAYRKTEDPFQFRVEGDKVSGFTVELIKQSGGNLKETDIEPSEF